MKKTIIKRYGQSHKTFPEPEKIDNATRYFLDEEGEAWIDVFYSEVAKTVDFEDLWELHPTIRGKIKIMGKEIEVPRWQQSYEKPYWFSGMMHDPLPTPEEFLSFLEEAKHSCYDEMYGSFNEILVNWYENGEDYIGAHSDDEKQMVLGPNGESIVYSLTLQEEPGNRIFRLKPKLPSKGSISGDERKRIGKERIDMELKNGVVVVMGGLCQKKFKHQVPKTKKPVGRRINVTFRCFKE